MSSLSVLLIFFLLVIILIMLFKKNDNHKDIQSTTSIDSYNSNPHQWSIDQTYQGCMSARTQSAENCKIIAEDVIKFCGNAPPPGSLPSSNSVQKYSKCAACLIPNFHMKKNLTNFKMEPYLNTKGVHDCLNNINN